MAQTVIGVFDNATEAQQAVQALLNNGFSTNQVDLSASTAGGYSGSTTGINENEGQGFSDSVGNFFGSLFGNSDQASSYSNVARNSGSIVTVHAQSSDEAQRAALLLDNNGAVDIDERAVQYGYSSGTGTLNSADTAETVTDATTGIDETNAGKSIQIIEEDLQVGKRTVETGSTRLRSRIVETPVEEHLRLREEHVRVERTPVNRPASEADFAAFKEGTIEMNEQAEVPVVHKEARVVEEISLSKEVTERQETIRDTVRSTEVDVENLGRGDLSGTVSTDTTSAQSFGSVSGDEQSLTITQLFKDRASAEEAYQYVRTHGYDKDEVNVMMADETRKRHFSDDKSGLGEKALEGAGTGSAIGGTLGAIVGAIAAIGTSIALPGLGLVVAGPIAAGLAGAGAGGLAGGLVGALAKAGVSESKAKEYETGIKEGGILLSVQAHSAEEARQIEQAWHGESASRLSY